MLSQEKSIRSFVRRQGRMTRAQNEAIDVLSSKYCIDYQMQTIDINNYFDQPAPIVLEIGFGMGSSLLEMAQHHPEMNFLGIEVYRPGIGSLLSAMEKNSVHNIRVICADAVEVLNHMIKDNSLSRVQIFFPDPWPKKRHHKRRLIQLPFIQLIYPKLKSQGILHLATDWQPYAEHMLQVINEFKGFNEISESTLKRPLTKFEKRGNKLGHEIWDGVFVNNDNASNPT